MDIFDQIRESNKRQVREDATTKGMSAAYLKARVQFLTTTLIKQWGELLDVAMTPEAAEGAENHPPSTFDITNQQLTVDNATQAIIRAAEELMVLTRTMKELWLFDDLDTLEKDESPEEKEKTLKLRDDEAIVVQGFQEWLKKNSHKLSSSGNEQDTATSEDRQDP